MQTMTPHRHKDAAGDRCGKCPCRGFQSNRQPDAPAFEKEFIVAVVNEKQFEIGGISHFAASEFSEAENCKLPGRPVSSDRLTAGFRQIR